MKVLIAAGGTGGHITPGIAIANMLKEKGNEVIFIGTDTGMEVDLVPKAGYELKLIHAYGLKRKFTIKNIKAIIELVRGLTNCKKIIKEEKPDLVIGTGGYVTAPLLLAAHKMKIPAIIHESNALPGKTTKLLSRKIDCTLIGFEEAKNMLPKAKKIVYTGNPTKIQGNLKKEEIKEKLGIKKPLVLIYGGSQGAKKLNKVMIEIINESKEMNYQIIYATGPKNYEEIMAQITNQNPDIKIEKYIYNMEEIMTASDLVVSRSGALTITELEVMGKPAILIPLPTAAENHQYYNAKTLEKKGMAVILEEEKLSSQKLKETIEDIINDKEKIAKMSKPPHKIKALEKIEKEINELIV